MCPNWCWFVRYIKTPCRTERNKKHISESHHETKHWTVCLLILVGFQFNFHPGYEKLWNVTGRDSNSVSCQPGLEAEESSSCEIRVFLLTLSIPLRAVLKRPKKCLVIHGYTWFHSKTEIPCCSKVCTVLTSTSSPYPCPGWDECLETT